MRPRTGAAGGRGPQRYRSGHPEVRSKALREVVLHPGDVLAALVQQLLRQRPWSGFSGSWNQQWVPAHDARISQLGQTGPNFNGCSSTADD